MSKSYNVNIFDVKDGNVIKFNKHSHTIIQKDLDVTNHIGDVVYNDGFEVSIKLRKNYKMLKDWDNALIFHKDADEYEDVEVRLIDGRGENE